MVFCLIKIAAEMLGVCVYKLLDANANANNIYRLTYNAGQSISHWNGIGAYILHVI